MWTEGLRSPRKNLAAFYQVLKRSLNNLRNLDNILPKHGKIWQEGLRTEG